MKGGNEKEEGRKGEGKEKKKKTYTKILCNAAPKFLMTFLAAFRPIQK